MSGCARDAVLGDLGCSVIDTLTGIEGVLLALTVWHDRSNECAIQRQGLDAAGQPYELHWCPQSRVKAA